MLANNTIFVLGLEVIDYEHGTGGVTQSLSTDDIGTPEGPGKYLSQWYDAIKTQTDLSIEDRVTLLKAAGQWVNADHASIAASIREATAELTEQMLSDAMFGLAPSYHRLVEMRQRALEVVTDHFGLSRDVARYLARQGVPL